MPIFWTDYIAAPVGVCPECGAPLELHRDGEVGVPYANLLRGAKEIFIWHLVARPFVACTRCEFCQEL